MQKISAAVALIAFIALASPVGAQGLYAYSLTSEDVKVMSRDEGFDVFDDPEGQITHVNPYGNVEVDVGVGTSEGKTGYYCRASMCVVGVYVYTKNDISPTIDDNPLIPGSVERYIGLYDPSREEALGHSGLAFQASVLGFMAIGVVKGLGTTIIAIIIAYAAGMTIKRMAFDGVSEAEKAWGRKEGRHEKVTSGVNPGSGDSPDGAEPDRD